MNDDVRDLDELDDGWKETQNGNEVLILGGVVVGTVFYTEDRDGYDGYKGVVEGEFSDLFDEAEDAKQWVEANN